MGRGGSELWGGVVDNTRSLPDCCVHFMVLFLHFMLTSIAVTSRSNPDCRNGRNFVRRRGDLSQGGSSLRCNGRFGARGFGYGASFPTDCFLRSTILGALSAVRKGPRSEESGPCPSWRERVSVCWGLSLLGPASSLPSVFFQSLQGSTLPYWSSNPKGHRPICPSRTRMFSLC
jgi:hypothetical protein